ncbi:flagellar hook-basal body complex protein FliE [Erythrobacter sp. LQ02-29]|uniref:flagellar hook-basal body complex protein FliE n=1 Tax=Erythrobacter sp. LQ02-29 TaxID=2920384 RepID=UPI001F4D5954|nr:flagellar hook-basal body complex protein FliE [Erythrobacter sp. LQ02-29]MCP9221256.1 flagellar hook-basal body complex protein FliE [Erythrobacter sp. LQ02-29]
MSGIGPTSGVQQVMDLRRQIMERSDALKTLNEATGKEVAQAAPTGTAPVGGGFADVLKGAVESVSATQTRASDITAAYERGEVTDVAQVMLARQEAGIAFEATLQVRNKLLSAYQDIMRMGV